MVGDSSGGELALRNGGRMIDIDAFMADAVTRDTIPDISPNEHYGTRGGLEWGDAPFRLRAGHVLDMKGSTLELDVDRVTDAMILSEAPILLVPPEISNIYGKTGEEAWGSVLTHQRVQNVRFVANFSKLVVRARALGAKSLRISGAGLLGHDAVIDNVELSDFGAFGHECFPLWIAGTDSGFDHNALYTVDPAHVYDEGGTVSRITNTRFVDYVPAASNDQVTVRMIVGTTSSEKIIESPWSEPGPYRQIMRRAAEIIDPVTGTVDKPIGTPNIVQACTIYQSLQGLVDGNDSHGASIFYYSDFCRSKGVHITARNVAKGGTWGMVVRLSPTAGGAPTFPEQFSAEDFVIEKFECDAGAGDVYVNADLPNTSSRYIRNIAIDERLRIVNEGDRAGVVKIPAPASSRKGCNPFGR